MRAKHQDLEFHEESNCFNLDVTFYMDKLTVNLEDFVDRIAYSASFTKEHIGKEINPKMDLMDVYAAFEQSKPDSSEGNTKNKEHQIMNYGFGQVVHNQRGPCYKIEQGGVVTAYWVTLDKRTQKDVIFESKLKLKKVDTLNQKQIEAKKEKAENNAKIEELNKKIQKKEMENQNLLAIIDTMEQQSTKLKAQLKNLKEQQNQKNQRFEQKITQTNQHLQGKVIQLTQENQQLLQKISLITRTNQQEQFRIELKIQNLEQKVLSLTQANQRLTQANQQNQQKYLQMTKKPHYQETPNNLPFFQQANSAYFGIQGKRVQYKGTNTWTHYIFNHPIHPNKSSKFELKIICTQGNMVIGLVDSNKQKYQRSTFTSDSDCFMGYYGSNGYKYPENRQEGDGFEQGDVVEVVVNRGSGIVMYLVNGTLAATQNNYMLTDSSRVFMPFFQVVQTNDTVQWVSD